LDLLKHNPKDIPAKTQIPAQAAPIQEKKNCKALPRVLEAAY